MILFEMIGTGALAAILRMARGTRGIAKLNSPVFVSLNG